MRWPKGILGPAPGLKEINLICWGLFFLVLVAPLSVLLGMQLRAGKGFDFVYFYGIGRLANDHAVVNLYNYDQQVRIFNELSPLHDGFYGPSPYPPYVALFFSLFARIPFKLAYLVWMAVSLTLYLIGVSAAVRQVFQEERLKRSLVLCLSLAFPPFLWTTLVNGQIASIAVCGVGLATLLERKQRFVLSGIALSMLSYKPTLLLLLIPMLLLTRRLKTLLGFVTGFAGMVLIATLFDGIEIWTAYAHFLRFFSQVSRIGNHTHLQDWQFIDFNSHSYAIAGGRSAVGLAVLIGIGAVAVGWLATLLWKSANGQEAEQFLAWAATLTWTLLLNIYVPIYDSILVTIAVLLTLGALRELNWANATNLVVLLALVTLVVAWFTEAVAKTYGFQPLTILFLALGIVQCSILHRVIRQRAVHGQAQFSTTTSAKSDRSPSAFSLSSSKAVFPARLT